MRCRARALAIATLVGLAGGCGQWQRTGAQPHPRPAAAVPGLSDARAIYRAMGLVVGSPPLAFVASLHFLADASPDSTLAVFGLSLANRVLSFHQSGKEFVAQYHVELTFRSNGLTVRQVARDETVRLHSFQETLRSEESIIFQQFLAVRPGTYLVRVAVRDRTGPAYSEQEVVDTVPRLGAGSLGGPIPIYQGAGRNDLGTLPDIVVNPRATVPYGTDTLRFYVEGYGLPAGTRVASRLADPTGVELWRDTLPLAGDAELSRAEFVVTGELPVGRAEIQVAAVGVPSALAQGPLLVGLSDQWAIANFEEMVTLFRYFDRQDLVAKLRAAPRYQRAATWREFYRASDPVPLTPENEAID